MKMIRNRVCGAILSVWWLAGCGGSSANLGGFSSSIDGKTVIAQLTPQQQQTLCGEVEAFSSSSQYERDGTELFCRTVGILAAYLNAPDGATDSQLRALCQTNYDTCTTTQSPGTCNVAGAATCTATVAELSACLNDTVEMLPADLKQIPSCDQISAATFMSGAPPAAPQPASCTTYQSKCSSMM